MAYKAIIEILLDVETYGEALDAIAETMRENMRAHASHSCLVDWRWVEEFPLEVAAIPVDFNEDSPWPSAA